MNFGGPRLAAALNYSASGFATIDCTSANGCHNAGTNEWKYGLGANACADCHAATGKTLDQGGYPAPNKSSATKHTKHIDNTAYVTGGCDDCHGAYASAGGHAGHKNGTAETAATAKLTSYTKATKTCVTSCHLANTTNDWTDAVTLACVDCHAGDVHRRRRERAVLGPAHRRADRSPAGRTTTVSSTTAAAAPRGCCDLPHRDAVDQPHRRHAHHAAGTPRPPSINFAANVGFVDGTPPTCAPSLRRLPHRPASPASATWSRKWSTSATNTDGTECANCHGGSPTDAAPTVWTAWTTNAGNLARPNMTGVGGPGALTAAHATDWDGVNGEKIQTTHAACKTCHGMNSPTDAAPAYNVTRCWGAPGFHGNGSIDLNGPSAQINAANNATPVGAEYNGNDDATLESSDYSCTKACHQGAENANKNMGDSGWPLKYGDYGAGTCNGCHGYPPLTAADMGTKGANYPDALVDTTYGGYAGGGDAHNAPDHVATTVTAADGWTPCLPCHPSTSHMTTTSVLRANISVAFPAAYNAKSGAASFTAGAGPTAASCSNVSCHGGQTTPFWSGGTINVATQCTSCHVAEAVASQAAATQWNSAFSGLHARAGSVSLENHTAADASVGDITDSSACTAVPRAPGAALLRSGHHGHGRAHRRRLRDHLRRHGREHLGRDGLQGDLPQRHERRRRRAGRASGRRTITATDGTECANCHGTWVDGWVTGVSHRTDAGPTNQHGTTVTYPQRGCNECHAIGDAALRLQPEVGQRRRLAGNHGNESIELNNNSSANPQRLTGADAGKTGCNGCHLANDGFAAGQHSFPTVTRWGFATLTNGQYSGCTGCHGTNGSNVYPDGGAQNGSGYENRAGAHQKHVAAIAARNAGGPAQATPAPATGATPAARTPATIRPAGRRLDGARQQVQDDHRRHRRRRRLRPGLETCTNVDCHAGATTPGWYYTPDTAAPVWTPNSGIAATNPNQGGVLNVTWNAATDAYPSNPVTYDLYKSTTNSAAAVFAGPPIATDLVGTSTTVTGLVDGTTYYFGVRAKDNWVTRNVTANTDISAGVAPGAATPATPTSTVYYLTKPASATNLWSAVNTNLSLTCGTATSGLAVSTAPLWTAMPSPAAPPAGRGLLTTAKVCGTASTENYMASNATAWTYHGAISPASTPRRTPTRPSSPGRPPGTPSVSRVSTYPSYDQVLVLFAAVDSSGNHTADTTQIRADGGPHHRDGRLLARPELPLGDGAGGQPAGGPLLLLRLLFRRRESPDRLRQLQRRHREPDHPQRDHPGHLPADLERGRLRDRGAGRRHGRRAPGLLEQRHRPRAGNHPPGPLRPLSRSERVLHRALGHLNLYRSGLGSTSFQDTGLTNGLTYCYGVRAKDSANPPNSTSNDAQTATATPSRGAAFGCNSCHASPPTSGGNAGSHAAHANNDADYTDCNNCHPGTTSYTNSHQDGVGQLAFDGTAATAVYNGNQLSYTDNATGDLQRHQRLRHPHRERRRRDRQRDLRRHAGHLLSRLGDARLGRHGRPAPRATTAAAGPSPRPSRWPARTSRHPGERAPARTATPVTSRGCGSPCRRPAGATPTCSATNMRTQLGIAYTNAGGIDLGGPGTVASINARATEAEICWGCHDAVATPVSEWGYNTKTTPAGYPVATFATADGNQESENHGWIYTSASYATKTSDWTQGFWMSAVRPAPEKAHRVGALGELRPRRAVLERGRQRQRRTGRSSGPPRPWRTRGRSAARTATTSTTPSAPDGKPYLRGTWVGDPYPPELPPRSGYTYTTAVGTMAARRREA